MKATVVAKRVPETQQFLTFLLEDQEYGLEIFKIREIRGYAPITPNSKRSPACPGRDEPKGNRVAGCGPAPEVPTCRRSSTASSPSSSLPQ
jgi:hypothetical protein